jgi:hypothetical protein
MTERETVSTSDLAGRTADEDQPLARDDESVEAQERPVDVQAEAEVDEEERDAAQGQPAASATDCAQAEASPLLPDQETSKFEQRWEEIQTTFVDEPRQAVERADMLVADLMQRIAASFSDTRSELEGQWDRGDDVSTEDLRVALTRYRSFFNRLLSA